MNSLTPLQSRALTLLAGFHLPGPMHGATLERRCAGSVAVALTVGATWGGGPTFRVIGSPTRA